MFKILTSYILPILLLVLGLALSATDILAGMPLLIVGLLFLPPVSSRIFRPKNIDDPIQNFPSKKFKVLTSIIAIILSFSISLGNETSRRNENAAKKYQENPAELITKIEASLSSNKFFEANYAIDGILKKLPTDQKLIDLKDRIFLAELKVLINDQKFLHIPQLIEDYKRVIPGGQVKSKDLLFFEKSVGDYVKKNIGENKFSEAKFTLKYLDKAYPENTTSKTLLTQISNAEQEFDKKQAAIAKAKAAHEASQSEISRLSSQNTNQVSDGRCVVGAILHDYAFYCGENLCGIDDRGRTVMVINGNILPPHATKAHMVKPGYRCACTRTTGNVHHDKIECTG